MRLVSPYIVDFSKVSNADENLVGKKASEIGELWKLGVPLPNGFVITTEFFKEFLRFSKINKEIERVQALSHPAILSSIEKLFYPIRKQVIHQEIPKVLITELHKFYRKLSGMLRECSLNIFSSSLNNKSTVFLNVLGDTNMILKIKTIWSMSLTEPVAVVIQENIKFQTKGKIFTDNLIIDKKLTKVQINKLTDYCSIIQKHFYFPKEVEYAVKKDKLFITNLNSVTGINESPKQISNNKKQKVLIKGIPINPGIATGPVRVLSEIDNSIQVKKEEVAVLPNLNPSLFSVIKKAKAIVVDSILPNSLEKALYMRDFQIPTVAGVKNATKMFQNGSVITVNGMSGEIYSGGLLYY